VKKIILSFFSILFLTQLISAQKKDSCYAGVYLTKEDFLNNIISYKINTGAKGYKFGFAVPADWTFEIKIITPDTSMKFKAGSVYGYYECGQVFRYSPERHELYAPEDFYKIEEAGNLIIYTSEFVGGNEYFYSLDLTSPIHRLKMKNLEEDFKNDPEFLRAVKCLNRQEEPGDIVERDAEGHFIINKIYQKIVKK